MEKKFYIRNLDCANCAQKVENAINNREDIINCSLSFANELLIIESKNEIDMIELQQFIQTIEPDVILEDKKSRVHHKHHHECDCGHEHHHHEHHHECDCEHEHHHHEHHHECDCGHEHHHHEHHHECDCGHEHHHHEHHHECDCGHEHHHHEHHHECDCEHEHHHHEHHHECDCEHEHHHHEVKELNGKDVITFSIIGLDCANCAMKVETAINKMDIVEKAVLNFSTETLQVQLKNKVEDHVLLSALSNTINNIEDGVTIEYKKGRKIEKPQLFNIKENIALVIGVALFIISLFTKNILSLVISFISYLFIGKNVLKKAFKNILRGEIFDENFLMTVASLGAFIIGEYSEAVAVLLFYSLGEIFQAYAVNKTRTSISSLMDIKSEYANVKTQTGIKQVSPEEVEIDDIVVVKVGEKVPLDGVVVSGQSSVDTSSLTGESLPRNVSMHDEVLAGVINLSEVIEVKVTSIYEDSTVSKVLELIETAASKKAPIERFITRFARVYTPTVCLLALLLAVLPMVFIKDAVFTDWLYRALTFLVVSCPCALVISIPLGLYAGLGKASKIGALIKGGNYLELLKDVDTVVFDKTGTLTLGSFDVVEICGGNDLLRLGAYGEYYSNHPIGQSIVKHYHQHIDESLISHYKEIAGKGIEVYIDGRHILLGNEKYMNENHIHIQKPASIGTVVYIGEDTQYLGCIVVADTIKESTKKAILSLKQEGIKNTVMLTGDLDIVAQDVASKLNIDTVYSQLLPHHKVEKLEELLDDHIVAYVGDGINDAPVLARANIGIAMGGVGSDAAIEAADIVLMQDNIETIAQAIKVSKKTNMILKQNVVFTLVIKIGVLILTMFGLSNMWMGVFADVGVTLIAILNAMRLSK